MEDKKLGSKLYAVFDRTYMAFGSICNSCQHIITEKNKDEVFGWAWEFAKTHTEELLEELYAKTEPTNELPL